MHALRLVGVTEDGTHLVLTDDHTDFALPIDAALRSALRRDTTHHVLAGHADGPMSPVEVQALIRGGADAEEAAERAGWSVDKVRRYEGPILAERQHVARIAAGARLRPKGPASGSPTLLERVTRRLAERGVSIEDVEWDSWRSDDGQWVVELHFEETGHHRRGSWSFTKSSMSLRSLDREAARLSDDDPDLLDPGPDHDHDTPVEPTTTSRFAPSYTSDYSSAMGAPRAHVDEDSDLMATLRSTSRARTRRRGSRRHIPGQPDHGLVESPIAPGARPLAGDAPLHRDAADDPGGVVRPAVDDDIDRTLALDDETPTGASTPDAAAPPVRVARQAQRDPGLDGMPADGPTADPGAPRDPEAAPPPAQEAAAEPSSPDTRTAQTGAGSAVDGPESDRSAPPVVVAPAERQDPGASEPRADEAPVPDPGSPRAPETDPTSGRTRAAETGPTVRVAATPHPDPATTGVRTDSVPDPAAPRPEPSSTDDAPAEPLLLDGTDDLTPVETLAVTDGEPEFEAEARPADEFALPDHDEPHLPFEEAVDDGPTPEEDEFVAHVQGAAAAADGALSPASAEATPVAEDPDPEPTPAPAPRSKRTRRRASAPTTRTQAAPVTAETLAPSSDDALTEAPVPQPPVRSRRSTGSSGNRATAPAGPPENTTPPIDVPAPEQDTPRTVAASAKKTAPAKTAKAAPARKQPSRRKGRASVPAWDDIMFGAKPGDEE